MAASIWTSDRVDRLTALWQARHSAERIARMLGSGISRSAVLGKVYRMGLSAGREIDPPPVVDAAVKVRRPARPKRSVRALPVSEVPALDLGEPAKSEHGEATILSIGSSGCRWPFGDPRHAMFSLCGRSISRGSYCADHAQLAYKSGPARRAELDRLAQL